MRIWQGGKGRMIMIGSDMVGKVGYGRLDRVAVAVAVAVVVCSSGGWWW